MHAEDKTYNGVKKCVTLEAIGFCDTLVTGLKKCVTSPYSIHVNGSPSYKFHVSSGLRQDDPISPFLFSIYNYHGAYQLHPKGESGSEQAAAI